MKNIKIGPKLITSFLLMVALSTFMGIYLAVSLRHLNENNAVVYEKSVVPLGLLVQTADLAQEIRIQILYWRVSKTEEDRAAHLKIMDESYARLKELANEQKNRVIVEAGKKPLDELLSACERYVEEVYNYTRVAGIRSYSGITENDFTPALESAAAELRKAVDTAIGFRTNSVKKLTEENSQKVSKDHTIAVILLVAVGLISIFLGIYLTFSVTGPLSRVMRVISEIEKGNLTARVEMKRKDEFGILGRALDNLSTKLQTMFRQFQQDSDTLAGSAEELSSIGRQVSNATEQVNANISTMASGATQASANANEVAGTAEQMSTNVSTMAAAVEELSASINQISINATDANKISNEATVKSREATEAMNKLGNAAKEIGKVTDVIKKIADKTNLLALNATIEAASAGESGKGFAVVAGEIKELATQSAKSADDIALRIEVIQSDTGEAVTVINDVSEIITKINQSVEIISGHVFQQTKASNEIANNVAQVNVGAKRVASAIGEVAKGSRDMSHSAEEIARNSISAENTRQINQGADELSRLASDLKKALSHFRV